jgi:hypothetical protein
MSDRDGRLSQFHGASLVEEDKTTDVTPDEDATPDDDMSSNAIKIWAAVAFLLSLPVASIVGHHFDQGRGRAAGIAFAMIIGGVLVFQRQMRYPWFWMSIAALLIMHGALILLVPWTNQSLPAPELWPIGIADFTFVCGFIKLIEKLMTREAKGGSAI